MQAGHRSGDNRPVRSFRSLLIPTALVPGLGTIAATEPALAPEQSLAAASVPAGFALELVAAEPLVADPIAIDWGADGRLWVAEMADYPYGIDGEGEPGGRVRWLRDSDGDGRYDESVVFVDGLSFPAGLMAWGDAVLIAAAPDLLLAEDTDGDGRADSVTKLWSGFVTGNQQLRFNGLRWGLDNRVYCASGAHHGGFGKGNRVASPTGNEVELGSRDFSLAPGDWSLRPESGPAQFGRCRSDAGDWFGVQNSWPLWHYVLPDRYLARNPAYAAPDARHQVRPTQQPRVFPAKEPQKRFHGFDHVGRYTSACGIGIDRDSLLFPREPGVGHAFTCEPFHNLVQRTRFAAAGASFDGARADDGDTDFFASADRWCRPVMARTGPDGALWVVDMYRYMIEHPDWLPQEGKDELRPHYRKGEGMGRIYRVVKAGTGPRPVPDLGEAGAEGLVKALGSENGIVRDLAHRELVRQRAEMADKAAPLLRAALRGGGEFERLHALCALDGVGRLDAEDVARALADPSPAVRRGALRLAEALATIDNGLLAACSELARDPDPQVRLQFALSAGEWPDPQVGAALGELAVRADPDPFTLAAAMSSAAPHHAALADAARAAGLPRELTVALLGLGADGGRAETSATLLRAVAEARRIDIAVDHCQQLADRGRGRSLPRGAFLPLADHARALAADRGAGAGDRAEAIRLLGFTAAGDDPAPLSDRLTAAEPPAVIAAAATALARIGDEAARDSLLAAWPSLPPGGQAAVAEAFAARGGAWVGALFDRIEAGEIPASAVPATARERILATRDATLRARAQTAFDRRGGGTERAAVIEVFANALDMIPDHGRGADIFKERCAVCHQIGGEGGGAVGPDLATVTDRSKAGLMAAIIDPNAGVDPRYAAVLVTLAGGDTAYGLVVAETATSIVVKGLDGGERTIARDAIAKLESPGASLMPEGLEAGLDPQGMADLLGFIRGG